LSDDMVKVHGGELLAETKEGKALSDERLEVLLVFNCQHQSKQ